MTAVIFGFFGFVWFGWAQEDPPRRWRLPLGAGSVLSVLTAAAGGFLAWRAWNDGTVFNAETSPAFGVIVGIEFGVAALGSALLIWRKRADLVAPWIAFVVGVHFFPLAPLLRYPVLTVVAALVCLWALAAVPLARRAQLHPSAVTGAGTGTLLLLAALYSVLTVL
jgi:hypothetical protein